MGVVRECYGRGMGKGAKVVLERYGNATGGIGVVRELQQEWYGNGMGRVREWYESFTGVIFRGVVQQQNKMHVGSLDKLINP